jgi:hypothetical protein
MTVAGAHERVESGLSWDELPEVVLAVSLHETDRPAATQHARSTPGRAGPGFSGWATWRDGSGAATR